jgi:hypothetical protein
MTTLIKRSERKRYELSLQRGQDAPKSVRLHQFALRPVFIRTPEHWIWFRRYTRWLLWMPTLNRYRTIDTRLRWQ